jgi:hypothetical protein
MTDPLVEELQKAEYAQMSDAEAAAALNAKTVQTVVRVENAAIKRLAIMSGVWSAIIAGQRDANPQKAGLCIGVIEWLNDNRMPVTDMDLPEVQTMLSGLVSFGLMTEEHAGLMNALKDKTVPWTEANGLPEIGIGLVQVARR